MASTAPGSRTPIWFRFAKEVFDRKLGKPHQKERLREEVRVEAPELQDIKGPRRHHQRRRGPHNISVALQYLSAWLGRERGGRHLQPDGGRGHGRDLAGSALASGSRTAPSSPTAALSIGTCTRSSATRSWPSSPPARSSCRRGASSTTWSWACSWSSSPCPLTSCSNEAGDPRRDASGAEAARPAAADPLSSASRRRWARRIATPGPSSSGPTSPTAWPASAPPLEWWCLPASTEEVVACVIACARSRPAHR